MDCDNASRGEKVKPEKCSTLKALINEGTFYSRAEWLSRHEAHLELGRGGHRDVLMLGDSILHGWEWPGRPAVWQRCLGGYSVANLAVSGDYIQHLLWRIEHGDIGSFSPDIVLLLIGANNIDEYEALEICKGVMKILNRVRRSCPAARVVLTGLFPRGREPGTALRDKIRMVNEGLSVMSDGGQVIFHDPGVELLESDGSMERRMFYDYCHPNIAGYRRWGESLSVLFKSFEDGGVDIG